VHELLGKTSSEMSALPSGILAKGAHLIPTSSSSAGSQLMLSVMHNISNLFYNQLLTSVFTQVPNYSNGIQESDVSDFLIISLMAYYSAMLTCAAVLMW